MKDLSGKTLGIIHAGVWIAETGVRFAREIMPEVRLLHICDDSMQHDFTAAGRGNIPPFNYLRVANYAHYLQQGGADAVMVGCSTMNRSAEHARPMVRVPVLQIDRPMMDKAVRIGPRVGLLATLDTTVPSSTRILELAAKEAGREIEIVQLFSGEAYEALRRGDSATHDRLVLELIASAQERVDVVVLAQLSLALLEDQVQGFKIPVLNSGREGFSHARQVLEGLP